MSARRFTALAAALIAVAALTGGTAAATARPQADVQPTTFTGRAEGYGPTLQAAQRAADEQIYADYYGCMPPFHLIADGQLADGTWWAEVAANGCEGYV
jgi:hypothetical protein